jgi:CRP-like cAMP-binding protein
MHIVPILKQADIFYGFSDRQLERVASICKRKVFRLGETIFLENSPNDELYIISRGEIEIVLDPALVSESENPPARPTTIAILRRGQSFGEIALVDQGIRSAGARSASGKTELLVIPRAQLMALCEQDTELGYRLMRNLAADLATKLRNTDLRIRGILLAGEASTG